MIVNEKKEGCIIMKATERFYLCEHCGNMAGLIHDAGVTNDVLRPTNETFGGQYYR